MGKAVVTLSWGGDGPAHNGAVVIRASRRGFVIDDDVETYGPLKL